MNPIAAEALLSRLPAFYRERDEALGGPLAALLAVMAAQGQVLLQDLQRLYDDAFIETCSDELVPYIGDLLGVRPLHAIPGTAAAGQRALVANTLRLRRRKGTLPVLEEVALAATGWRASAMEFFEHLSATQHVNHVRLHSLRTPDLRQAAKLERIAHAFDSSAASADVRALARGGGPRPNIVNVGLFLWRMSAYPVQRATAAVLAGEPGHYSFDPLGRDVPLVNRPRSDPEAGTLAQPQDVPEPLSRRALADELNARRQALADGVSPTTAWFAPPSAALAAGEGASVLRVWLDGVEVPPEDLVVCHLGAFPSISPERWRRPPAGLVVARTGDPGTTLNFPQGPAACLVGIDPVLGRLVLPAGRAFAKVEVASAYAFPGDVGGGPYDRRGPAAAAGQADAAGLLNPADFQTVLTVPGTHPTLAAALAAVITGKRTLIRLLDDSTQAVSPTLNLPGTLLAVEAANRRRPVWVGDIDLQGDAQTRLVLSGLLIDGALRLKGPLRSVEVRHCSLVPARGGVAHTGSGPGLSLSFTHSLVGAVRAAAGLAGVSADTCVFDAAGAVQPVAIKLPDTTLTLNCCTVLGTVAAGELAAGHTVFDRRVLIQHRQTGCVRFCWVPLDNPSGTKAALPQTPRRYRCQPDGVQHGMPAAVAAAETLRVTPVFDSTTFGQAAYARLRSTTASEIRSGAENGAEMGVWNFLAQPQREANLRQMLDEYLRFGLEAGAIFAD
jgi:hypothetical protein